MAEVEHINPYGDDGRAKDRQVQSMFDSIAPAYDFMNRAMTGGMDRLWLRALVKAAHGQHVRDVADLATGTGDVAIALARRMPQARIIGIDLSEGMLDKARAKVAAHDYAGRISFRQGDCLATGLADASVDLITVAYGVRNFADLAAGYREMFRILRPGGKLCVLELSQPVSAVPKALYRLYTSTLIPLAGRLLSHDRRAYSYLPESIAAAPQRYAMTALINEAGFDRASFRQLTFGACTLYTAYKAK